VKKKIVLLAIALVLLPVLISTSLAQSATTPLALVNPGFEGEYKVVPGGYAAQGWTTDYKEGTVPPLAATGGGNDPTRRPEFKPIDADQYPNRVAEGERAQVAFAFFGIMDAAFSQSVQVEPGQRVQFSIQGHGWSTNTDNPAHHTGDVWVSLGIGAEGQTWPWEHGIVWTRYDWTPAEYRTYTSRDVTAESSNVTLFILVTNKWATKHNDAYIDDVKAWIVVGESVQPTPVPTQTPCQTPQPCPTSPPNGASCDYDIIRNIVHEELENREPARYP